MLNEVFLRWYFVPLKSYVQQGNRKKFVCFELCAVITGIQGVSSSEWLPMIQSASGNNEEWVGIIVLT